MANNNSQDYYNRKLATKYTSFTVKENAMLLDFIMKSMDGISRTKAKEFLASNPDLLAEVETKVREKLAEQNQ